MNYAAGIIHTDLALRLLWAGSLSGSVLIFLIQRAVSTTTGGVTAWRRRLPVPLGDEASAWKAGLLSVHAEIRSGKKAGVLRGFARRTDNIFWNFPDFVENVINCTTFGAFVVVDRHETSTP